MARHGRAAERLVALFVLGVVLLLPPVLLVFNRPERVAGIPVLYLYLFIAWALLIGLAAAIVGRDGLHGAVSDPPPPPDQPGDGPTPSGGRDA